MCPTTSINNKEILLEYGNDNDNPQEFCLKSQKHAKGIRHIELRLRRK